MNQKEILEAIQEARKNSKKRNFNQTFDLVINFKNLDLKNPEHNINTFLQLPHPKGKENKIGAIIGEELISKAKSICDEVIHERDLNIIGKDKKKIKKLAKKIDFFIAQVNIMPKIALILGKILGPMGKMPNPKAGCVISPTISDFKLVCDKLRNTVRLQTKNELGIKTSIGKEDNKDEDIAENVLAVYNHIVHLLPQEAQNIKTSLIKLTMGKASIIGGKKEIKTKVKENKEQKIKKELKSKEKKVKKNGKEKV